MWKLCLAVRSLVPFPSSLGVAPKKSFITVSKLCKASHETPKLCNVRLSACLLASPSCQSVPRVCLYFYCFHSFSFLQYPGERKKVILLLRSLWTIEQSIGGPSSLSISCLSPVCLSASIRCLFTLSALMPSSLTPRPPKP